MTARDPRAIATDPDEVRHRLRTRRRRIVLAIAAVIVVGVGLRIAIGAPAGNAGSDWRRTAPDFSLPRLDRPNGRIALADFRGEPLVLNFWASWCTPCRDEMPDLEGMSKALAGRVAFVGINHKDSRDDALAFARKVGVTYPSGHDPSGEIGRAYGVYGMPTTVLITRGRRLAFTRVGEISKTELARLVAKHLGVTTENG